ncbi:Hypothetical protein ADU73_0191 [Pediococcus damnosus]|uniref:preprotein translocase, YajC subunit, yajC n=1 Tax=Pediococcus damnosus TaxID=51663 RepID=UPI00078E1304|nr:preprotein translocase, YajC subunit, yajC [Pediococcus damnosus]AMV68601.1 Hypothetical protein ADU73_0191 [Pediococcus damnosus]
MAEKEVDKKVEKPADKKVDKKVNKRGNNRADKKEEEEEPKPFDVGDKVHVKKTALLPTDFDGQVGKVYENSILIDIDADSVDDSRSEELHDLHGRVIVRFAEAKKIEA